MRYSEILYVVPLKWTTAMAPLAPLWLDKSTPRSLQEYSDCWLDMISTLNPGWPRLMVAFGRYALRQGMWCPANPLLLRNSYGYQKPDCGWVDRMVCAYKPRCVILLGSRLGRIMASHSEVLHKGDVFVLSSVHPQHPGRWVPDQLRTTAADLAWVMDHQD